MLRLGCSWVGLLVALATVKPGFAQSAAPASEWQPRIPRLRVGAFTGMAVPFGKVTPQLELHEATPVSFSFGGDLAWGPVLPLDFGVMAAATLGIGEPEVCPEPSSSCSVAGGGQFALRARFYFRPEQRFTPWLGVGAGIDVFESTGESSETDGGVLFEDTRLTRRSSTYWGPLGMLLAGVDYRLGRRFALGGLVAFSVSPYLTVKDAVNVDGEDVTSSSGSLDPRLHQWLLVAAHLTFDQRL